MGVDRLVVRVVLLGALIAAGLALGQPPEPAGAAASGGEFVAASGRLTIGGTSGAAGLHKISVAGLFGVPVTGVSAVQVTVSAVSWATDGWVSAWPTGAGPEIPGQAAPSGASVLWASGGDRVSNTAIVALGTDGSFQLSQSAAGSVVVDLQGYFTVAGASAGGFHALKPRRLVDTRATSQPAPPAQPGVISGQKLAAAKTMVVATIGTDAAQAGVSAVAVNITTLNEASTKGYLRVDTSGSSSSPAIYHPDGSDTTMVTAAVTAEGKFTIFSSTAVDVIVDIQGYYLSGSDEDATFTPLQGRLIDHRTVAANATTTATVAGTTGVPSGVVGDVGGTSAVAVNVIENQIGTSSPGGYLRAWQYVAGGASGDVAGAPSLQYDTNANDQRTNMITVSVGASNAIQVVNHSSSPIVLTIDLQGFYTKPPTGAAGCAVDYQHRLNATYVSVFPHTDLANPNIETRNAAWRQLLNTLHLKDCVNRIAITSIADAHPGTLSQLPAAAAAGLRARGFPEQDPSRYYTSSTPLAAGQTEVDALSSVQFAMSKLPQPGPQSFRVTIGGRADIQTNGRFADWSDDLRAVSTTAQATTWATAQATTAVSVATDVWNAYPTLRPLIEGWHLPLEPTQVAEASNGAVVWSAEQRTAFRRYLVKATAGLDALHVTGANATVTRTDFAPSYTPGSDSVASWKPWLESLITNPAGSTDIPAGTVAVDIVGVQDRLWSYDRSDTPTATITGMRPYFAAARTVVDTINNANLGHLAPGVNPMQLWSDVEMFQPNNFQATAPVGNIIDALTTEAPYVDGFTSYSAQVHLVYGSYATSQFGLPRPEGDAYDYWVRHGALATNLPNAPVSTVTQQGADAVLSVTATDTPISPNDPDTAQVQELWVYRSVNGRPFERAAVCVRDIYGYQVVGCSGDENPVATVLTGPGNSTWTVVDPQPEPGSAVTYRLFTFNLSGNQSPTVTTAPLTITDPAHGPTNLALGKAYLRGTDPATGTEAQPNTANAPARADTGHTADTWSAGETTDGIVDSATAPNNARTLWQAYSTQQPVTTTIDLGTNRTIGEVTAQVLQDAGPGIVAPTSISVSVSTNATFTDTSGAPLEPWTTAWRPGGLAETTTPTAKTFRITGPAVQGRYLRVTITRKKWLFLSEIAAYAPA